jgi:outer membrane cobalamin receptor
MKKILNIIIFSILIICLLIPNIISAEEENIFTFEEIVVIASRYPEKLQNVPVSVELIDSEELVNIGAVSVTEILNKKSGLIVNDYGAVGSQKTVCIRGAQSRQVLILMDGQVLNSSQNGVVDLSMINTDQIERIEILKGPGSALYGANALGGVINIISKSGTEKPECNLKYSLGSFNTAMSTFSFSGS